MPQTLPNTISFGKTPPTLPSTTAPQQVAQSFSPSPTQNVLPMTNSAPVPAPTSDTAPKTLPFGSGSSPSSSSLSDQLGQRFQTFKNAVDAQNQAKSLPESLAKSAEAGVIGAGQLFGGAFDVLGAGMKKIGQGVSAITPDFIKSPVKSLVQSDMRTLSGVGDNPVAQFVRSSAGQKIGQVFNEAQQKWDTLPQETKDFVSSLGNIVMALPAEKLAELGGAGAENIAKTAGEEAKLNASRLGTAVEDKSTQGALDAIQPSAKSMAKEVSAGTRNSTAPGFLSHGKPLPLKSEIEAVDALKGIVDPAKSATENRDAIKGAISSEATSLQSKLKASGAIWNKNELTGALDKIDIPIAIKADTTLNNAFNLTKDAVLKIADSIPNKTADTLITVRQKLDNLMESQFGAKIWNKNDPMSNMYKSFRNAINNLVDEKVPSAEVKSSLRKQNVMFDALGNVNEKAAQDLGTNKLTQAFKGVKSVIDRHPYIAIAGALNVGWEGQVVEMALTNPIVLSSLASYGAYKVGNKVLTSDMVMNGLKTILEKSGNTLAPEEKSIFQNAISALGKTSTVGTAINAERNALPSKRSQ